MYEDGDSRWAGRSGAKAAIRGRVWSGLIEAQVNIGPVFDRIPNFVGADVAAKRLSELDEWRRARIVKCNPDPSQIPVRLRALYDGKLLFSPVSYSGLLHEALDPARGPDMKEAFNIGLDLAADDPELVAGKPFRSLNAWPELSGFRKTALAYCDACAALGARLHRTFARDLGLKPDFFADKFDRRWRRCGSCTIRRRKR
jgi:hypothetical protein